jgi:hypothetical protein
VFLKHASSEVLCHHVTLTQQARQQSTAFFGAKIDGHAKFADVVVVEPTP